MPKIKEYENLISETDFKNRRVWSERIKHYFPDEKALTGWIDQPGIIPFIAVLPENLKDSFRDQVIEKTAEKTKQPNKTYLEIFCRINVYAEKQNLLNEIY